MIIKIQPICKKNKIRKDGWAPIYLRFTYNGEKRYISTGIYIRAEDWNTENQRFTTEKPENEETRLKIESIRYKYLKRLKQLEALDKEITLDALLDEKKVRTTAYTAKECLEQTIEQLEVLGKYNSASKHKALLSLLRQYKSTPIRLEEIDIQFLNDFELFLRKRGNRNNSIATNFSILKAAYNKAAEEGKFKSKSDPFTKFKVGKLWTVTSKRAISKEDIQRIEQYTPLSKAPYLALARDIFLFSYYTAGINFCDIARLKPKNIIGERLYYTRHKTEKLLSYKLLSKAQEIIQRYQKPDSEYLFPILDSSHKTELQKFNRIHKSLAKTNKALKQIGEELKIPGKLTTYVARHSYATVLRRAGVSTSIISSSLGHSSEKVTQIYLDSFENKQIDEAMQNLV